MHVHMDPFVRERLQMTRHLEKKDYLFITYSWSQWMMFDYTQVYVYVGDMIFSGLILVFYFPQLNHVHQNRLIKSK